MGKRSKNFVLGASHGFKFTRFCDSQNLDLDCHADSANLLAMTEYYRFTLVAQSIRATNHNRSNGGVAFVVFGRFWAQG